MSLEVDGMTFTAVNMKDSFMPWRLALTLFAIGMTCIGAGYLWTEVIPNLYSKTFTGMITFDKDMVTTLGGLIGGIVAGDVFLIIVIRLLAKWEKEAKGYAFSMDTQWVRFSCDGQQQEIRLADVEKIEVWPKNCEPNLMKSKWTEVCVIFTGDKLYRLYYLKGMDQAKRLFDSLQNTAG